MRLLIVAGNPDRASFRQRIGVHLPFLTERGIRCEVTRLPAGAGQRRRLYRQASAFDAVLLQRKTLNPWDTFWLRRYGPKLLYDFDDAVMYSDHRPHGVSRGRRRRFRRTVTACSAAIAGNEYLASHARPYNESVHILPTGLDLTPYAAEPSREHDDKRYLVWIGSRSTLKYLDRIQTALEEIGRRHRDVVLRIVADAFLDLENMAVEKVAWSWETEAPSLLSSDIGVAPLSDDPFSRGKCGFKILQYQAAALPVVASPVGVNAEYVRDGITGFHAAGTEDWIGALEQLLDNPARRKSMGRAGRDDVARFGLKPIGKQLYTIICDCVQTKLNSPPQGCSPGNEGMRT